LYFRAGSKAKTVIENSMLYWLPVLTVTNAFPDYSTTPVKFSAFQNKQFRLGERCTWNVCRSGSVYWKKLEVGPHKAFMWSSCFLVCEKYSETTVVAFDLTYLPFNPEALRRPKIGWRTQFRIHNKTEKKELSFIHFFPSSDMSCAFIGGHGDTIIAVHCKRKMVVLKHDCVVLTKIWMCPSSRTGKNDLVLCKNYSGTIGIGHFVLPLCLIKKNVSTSLKMGWQ